MNLVFLVIQIILAVAIIGTILLQKNSGDGLGSIGGSGSSVNNIISGRATANFLTKATTFLMVCFMLNSIILGNIAVRQYHKKSIVTKVHHKSHTIKESEAKDISRDNIQAPLNK